MPKILQVDIQLSQENWKVHDDSDVIISKSLKLELKWLKKSAVKKYQRDNKYI